jgi:hypothetical protein
MAERRRRVCDEFSPAAVRIRRNGVVPEKLTGVCPDGRLVGFAFAVQYRVRATVGALGG